MALTAGFGSGGDGGGYSPGPGGRHDSDSDDHAPKSRLAPKDKAAQRQTPKVKAPKDKAYRRRRRLSPSKKVNLSARPWASSHPPPSAGIVRKPGTYTQTVRSDGPDAATPCPVSTRTAGRCRARGTATTRPRTPSRHGCAFGRTLLFSRTDRQFGMDLPTWRHYGRRAATARLPDHAFSETSGAVRANSFGIRLARQRQWTASTAS